MKLLTQRTWPLIGMIHVQALPGTPRGSLAMKEIRRRAVDEARQLARAGFDAVMIENMHDVPYLRRSVGPEIVAAMTVIARDVREAVECPLGIQILAGANQEALAAALASGAEFIRAEGFVYAHIADEGIIEADAGELLRYRKSIGAESIEILADIRKKHASHAVTADVSLTEQAETAAFFGADALVITGTATARPVDPGDLKDARAGRIPLFIGSGVTAENFRDLAPLADGFIVGSSLKRGGRWDAELEPERMNRLVEVARSFREARPHSPPALSTEIY
jgi:membrane complex biogenesis BtpA family protein